MPDLFPDERARARQSAAQILAASLMIAMGTAYLVARLAGLLPEPQDAGGLGTPLNAKPFFAQLPPVASLVVPLPVPVPVPVETTTAPITPILNADQNLIAQQNGGRAVLSIATYLKQLEQVENDKRVLLMHLMARAPQLRAALTTAGKYGGAASYPTADLPLNLPVDSTTNDMYSAQAWNRLIGDFEQQKPPETCMELHLSYIAYLKALRDCINVCLEPGGTAESGDGTADVFKTTETALQAKERLAAEANVAESALISVYAQAGLPKTFAIETENSVSR